MLGSFFYASRLPMNNLWGDFLVVLASAVCFMANMDAAPLDLYQNSSIGIRLAPYLVLGASTLGLHVGASVAFATALSVFVLLNPRSSTDNCVTIPFLVFFSAVLVAIVDYSLAALVARLQTQLLTTQRLLDHATDGFCTLDKSNKIIDVSPQLETTLGCGQLLGANFADFVEEADRHKLFKLGVESLKESSLTPVLATCRRNSKLGTGHCTFDAQIFPYASLENELNIFVRLLGEVREHVGEPESRAPPELELMGCADGRQGSGVGAEWSTFQMMEEEEEESTGGSSQRLKSTATEDEDVAEEMDKLEPLNSAAVHPSLSADAKEVCDETGSLLGSYAVTETSLGYSIGSRSQQSTASRQVSSKSLNKAASHSKKIPCIEASTQAGLPAARTWEVAVQTDIFEKPPMRSPEAEKLAKTSLPPRIPSTSSEMSHKSSSPQDHEMKRSQPDPSVLGQFASTGHGTMRHSLIWLLSHWNYPNAYVKLACCPRHAAIRCAQDVLRKMEKKACNPLWSPFHGWQCEHCSCTNPSNDALRKFNHCDMCGKRRVVRASEEFEKLERLLRNKVITSQSDSSSGSEKSDNSLTSAGGLQSQVEPQLASSKERASSPIVPVLRAFAPTEDSAMLNSLASIMSCWNFPLENACCPKHAAICCIARTTRQLVDIPCEPLWSPNSSWQCKLCTCMNDADGDICVVCMECLVEEEEEEGNVEEDLDVEAGSSSEANRVAGVESDACSGDKDFFQQVGSPP